MQIGFCPKWSSKFQKCHKNEFRVSGLGIGQTMQIGPMTIFKNLDCENG